MKKNYKDLKKQIDSIDKLIESFDPKEEHQDDIQDLLMKYRTYKKVVDTVMYKKANELLPNSANLEIDNLKEKINVLKEGNKLLKIVDNFYEGLEFSKILNDIDHPVTLEEFNNNIEKIINILKEIGITLSERDFNYTLNVNRYMKVLFEELNNNDKNTLEKNMKKVFDSIYWDNHDILKDISINIKNMLRLNEKKIIEYSTKKKNDYFNNNNLDESTIEDQLDSLKFKRDNLIDIDKFNILDKFISNEYNVNDFLDNSEVLLTNRNKLIDENKFNEMTIEEKEDFYKNVNDLSKNLFEYKSYEKFKYLVTNMKKIYDKKDQYKGIYDEKLKTIETVNADKKKLSDQLFKLNDKYLKTSNKNTSILFNESKKEKMLLDLATKIKGIEQDINRKLNEIRTESVNLEKTKFENLIASKINENCTVYDVLKMYKDNYIELLLAIKEKKKDIKEEELTSEINDFYDFINSPYMKIIKIMNFINLEEFSKIIEEKYKLSNFNIKIDKIDSPSFKELEDACNFIDFYNNINNSGYSASTYKLILDNKDNVIEEKVIEVDEVLE